MLTNVHIKNLALISEADIDFEKGLNIMTGETGSGKSIIISSINIALGDKANKGIIRKGCSFGIVELLFSTDDSEVFKLLNDLDLPVDGNNILISRKITQESSISKVNGESTTLNNIKKITSKLIDIHGQHDHQSLLDPDRHLDLIDAFDQIHINELKSKVAQEYNNYKSIRKELLAFEMDDEALAKETELVRFEISEIEHAQLKNDEDKILEAQYRKMSDLRGISESLNKAYSALSDESSGAFIAISQALREVEYASSSKPDNEEIRSLKNGLSDIESITSDYIHEIGRFINNNRFDAVKYKEIGDRLNEINKLKLKYGKTVSEILGYYERSQDRLDKFVNYSKTRDDLKKKLAASKALLNKNAHDLSDFRKETAKKLEPLVAESLKDLNFLTVDFRISFSKSEKITVNGFDKAEFLISTNPGEEPKPLAKVASGGELSRIMLALKASVAEKDEMPTLIFDEIDTGISGFTAQKVSEKLNCLSRSHQLICITHLPQIAAMADTHFVIQKEVSDGTTISGIEKLSKDGEVLELARLLSGAEVTETTVNNAKELKNSAKKLKDQY